MSSAEQKNVQIVLLIHSRQFVIYNIFFRVHEITNMVGKLLLFLLFIRGEEWEHGQAVVESYLKMIWHPRS